MPNSASAVPQFRPGSPAGRGVGEPELEEALRHALVPRLGHDLDAGEEGLVLQLAREERPERAVLLGERGVGEDVGAGDGQLSSQFVSQVYTDSSAQLAASYTDPVGLENP